MNGKVLIELTHEEHYRLLEALRIGKASGGFPSDESERRILYSRRCLGLPEDSRWVYYDWTPEDEKKEREEEARRMSEFYNFQKTP